jgi:transcriptional regulator with XRE-family HTH domain
MTIQQNVKLFRKALGLTQQELAQILDVTIRTVSRFETSDPPKGKTLLKLAEMAREGGRPALAAAFQDAHQLEFEQLERQLGEVVKYAVSASESTNAASLSAIQHSIAEHALRKRLWERLDEFHRELAKDAKNPKRKLDAELHRKYDAWCAQTRKDLEGNN